MRTIYALLLASLDSKKQALFFGHAMAMPVVMQTREYNEDFYRAMSTTLTSIEINQVINELF